MKMERNTKMKMEKKNNNKKKKKKKKKKKRKKKRKKLASVGVLRGYLCTGARKARSNWRLESGSKERVVAKQEEAPKALKSVQGGQRWS